MPAEQKINPSIEDTYAIVGIKPNTDGSITRINSPPNVFACDYKASDHLSFVDVLKPTPNVAFIRLFRPPEIPPNTKLPLVIYFHAGGFVLLSAATLSIHQACQERAAHIPAIIASVEYRLAPEHRLPAAYDDAVESILWVKSQALGGVNCHPWMKQFVDFSKVFLMGDSAGGNIVYHAGLRALDLDLRPMKIVGLIMNQPPFGGMERTESELKNADDRLLPLHACDLFWSLSLPEGSDRGHHYCDPFGRRSHDGKIIGKLPASYVRGCSGDPLIDRQKEFAKMLKKHGVNVVTRFIDGGYHAVEAYDPSFAQVLNDDLKEFISSVDDDALVN